MSGITASTLSWTMMEPHGGKYRLMTTMYMGVHYYAVWDYYGGMQVTPYSRDRAATVAARDGLRVRHSVKA